VAGVFSGALLAAAFPPLEWRVAGWLGLTPLWMACAGIPVLWAARAGFAAGAVFWLLTLHWLTHVSRLGWVLLSLYCGLYFVLPAVAAARHGGMRGGRRVLRWSFLPVVTVVWVGMEYLRAHLFTGFTWNQLGVSQYGNTALIQIAGFAGVYGISAVMVLGSGGAALALLEIGGGRRARMYAGTLVLAAAWLLPVGYGLGRLAGAGHGGGCRVRMALVQPAIPQFQKWTERFISRIYERLERLTDAALHAGAVDLVVWPETALPEDLRSSERAYGLVSGLARRGVPLLVGSMDTEVDEDGRVRFYNSAFLFDRRGRIVGRYDKQHLVMFGEYVPLQRWLPFMRAMTPIQESFTAGRGTSVMAIGRCGLRLAVLICFEDTIAPLARAAVRAGARLLVNQTNDAWFDISSASRQHMAHCVFRCVENRVPAVRATNTGLTCAIDRYGRVYGILGEGGSGRPQPGFQMVEVDVDADAGGTFYTRRGDVFAVVCCAGALGYGGWLLWGGMAAGAGGKRKGEKEDD